MAFEMRMEEGCAADRRQHEEYDRRRKEEKNERDERNRREDIIRQEQFQANMMMMRNARK